MKKEQLIRCVNLDNGKVKIFPYSICTNLWWQKTTRFIPQPIEEIQSKADESTIINTELSESVSEHTETIDVELEIETDESEKPKRKYTKKKKQDDTNSAE